MGSLNYEFPVCLYGQLQPYNEVLSKGRCRIFYKYENRNGTYITDDFAEQLIASLPYAPVKGIYRDEDFTDHGTDNAEGKIYGIVPENPNAAWEIHTDEDGVTREYACADVLVFTALYPEASDIVGKPESMELYRPSIKYHKEIINGQRYVVFDRGCFLGLQVLGDAVEPCFEGASFYSLRNSVQRVIDQIKEISRGGQTTMSKVKFKLSDDQKFELLWDYLNPECNEEGGWVCDYTICAVYDEYALVLNFEANKYERIYYTKNDEEDTLAITGREFVVIEDITEKEKVTLDALRRLNGDTYELVSENLENADKNAEEIHNYESKNVELEATITTLNTKVEELQGQLDEAGATNATLKADFEKANAEVENLRNYKHSIETQQKQAVIAEYAGKLSTDMLETYATKLDEYSVLDLDKELAYELKKSGASMFADQPSGFVPKEQDVGGIESILSKYKK